METKLFEDIHKDINAFIAQESALSKALWREFIDCHPADIAQFLSKLDKEDLKSIYLRLPKNLKIEVFLESSDHHRLDILSFLDDHGRMLVLAGTPVDELTDLFDLFSAEQLGKYLTLLRQKDREQVLALMQFAPESAGGIMDVNVWSLMKDFSVEQSIQFLRRLQAKQELHHTIYITNSSNVLVGHINLEDLVLKHPKSQLEEFMQKNELTVRVNQDQEEVVNSMLHYGLSSAPVVDENNLFLGVISSDTLAEVLEKEATEDVYKLSAVKPIKQTYFETSFLRLLFERGYILVILLLAESVSGIILKRYEKMISSVLLLFLPMLMSTGGNTSHQTSALVIRGMTSGEIGGPAIKSFLKREFLMAAMLASILGITAFVRVMITTGDYWLSFIVSLACAMVVMVSVTLGSSMPILLKKFNIDPMFSAGPTLATTMDVLSVLIYCYIASLLLS